MQALQDLRDEMVSIYGYVLQVDSALVNWRSWLQSKIDNREAGPQADMFFGREFPDVSGGIYQYKESFKGLLQDSSKDGITAILLRRSAIVFSYSFWEDKYRALVGEECGVKKGDVVSDIFGDLNKYRRSVIHENSVLQGETTHFKFFKKGEMLDFTEDQMYYIFVDIIEELNRIGREYYGTDPGFRLDVPLKP